jgi:hypothetical protein
MLNGNMEATLTYQGQNVMNIRQDLEYNKWYSHDSTLMVFVYKGNNKITELRTILQRESPNS